MAYIIHGATGAQGAPLLKRIARSGKHAVAAVHLAASAVDVPSVRVDNASVDSLIDAYRGADGVFVHLPQAAEADRVAYARNIAQAVDAARPKRVVISTSGAVVDQPGSPLQVSAESAIALLIEGIQNTGVPMAVVAPRLYLENLLLPMVLAGVQTEGVLRYPLRADFLVSWSSHQDVAEVAERLFSEFSITGVVGVGQLPGLMGADLAAGFSQHLGRDVRFERLQPEAFGELIAPLLGPAASAVVGLYQALAEVPSNTIDPATSAQRLLNIAPRSIQQWLAGTPD